MRVGFLLFSDVHRSTSGSSRLRGTDVIENWPEAERYVYGQKYNVVIHQKVYHTDLWKPFLYMPDTIKILDMCDPDWFEDMQVKETADGADAITCSSERLCEFMRTITTTPVFFMPDRHDVGKIKPVEMRYQPLNAAVWFGFAHNQTILRDAVPALERMGLDIYIISNRRADLYHYASDPDEFAKREHFIQFDVETLRDDLAKGQVALLPDMRGPRAQFKSNNRTTLAWLYGLPVAKTADDLKRFTDPNERNQEVESKRKIALEEYNVGKTVEQYQQIIEEVKR